MELVTPPSPDDDEDDVRALAERLAAVLSQTSKASRFHLQTALQAAELDGVGGTLIIALPPRTKDYPIVKWVGGGSHLDLPI